MKRHDKPRSEYEKVIEEWIFSERDRRLIRRRLFDGITYEALAEEFDLSVTQVKRIIYKTEAEIIRHI